MNAQVRVELYNPPNGLIKLPDGGLLHANYLWNVYVSINGDEKCLNWNAVRGPGIEKAVLWAIEHAAEAFSSAPDYDSSYEPQAPAPA